MTLRPAGVDDLGAIMVLERAAFGGDAWSDDVMRAELASPHTWYVVTEEDGRLVGYAGLRAPAGSRDADVQTIALDETVRGRGLGREIFRALLDEARRRGVSEVFLDVRADNTPAQRLYASEGFEAIGRRPNYYPGEGVDAIVMRRRLDAHEGGTA
ncbi:ribosomal protein S18-alanine N-acetyltransferase [Microbacterium invictum]|uniref:[Ribosomal protein bS18]-alanine N-acetyltransferase n=1 Tax=Microbacterium invictum TaxID=515415 RepID=A0ABZ0VD35_9MICO|nr:ribosomal protein S18-alanine N-acetyltransferase [Microbacterium invictum]WQB69727.1 ribosomal protein S18-alanine N-acetyltransferase [Microbacterium invictum]